MAEPFILTESILTGIKKLLGMEDDYVAFDTDIILLINDALFSANQLGLGPAEGFEITGKAETWSDFIGARKDLAGIKKYVYQKVKLAWDPPQAGYLVEAMKEQIKESEVRLNIQVEGGI